MQPRLAAHTEHTHTHTQASSRIRIDMYICIKHAESQQQQQRIPDIRETVGRSSTQLALTKTVAQ